MRSSSTTAARTRVASGDPTEHARSHAAQPRLTLHASPKGQRRLPSTMPLIVRLDDVEVAVDRCLQPDAEVGDLLGVQPLR
jgi:hypothetical protein